MLYLGYLYICTQASVRHLPVCVICFLEIHYILLLTKIVHNHVKIPYNMVCTSNYKLYIYAICEVSSWASVRFFRKIILNGDVFIDFLINRV